MIMATRIFYLMFKNTAKWNVYKVAYDKREGIHNLISHLKVCFIKHFILNHADLYYNMIW